MLILAKAAMAIMIGFITALICGFILVPMLKKLNVRQKVSLFVGERHLAKDGTPTIGGLIFIIPTFLVTIFLFLRGSVN